MDYQVIVSPLALEDLEKIVRYIAGKDSVAAERFGTRLLDEAEALGTLPHRGGMVRGRRGVRKLLLGSYLIFYRADDVRHRVEILRFWHGAQDSDDLRLE